MKLTTLLSVCVLATGIATPSLFAQNEAAPQGERQKGERRGGRMTMSPQEQVDAVETAVGKLTAEQKTKLLAIYTKSREQLQAVPQEQRREKAREVWQAQREEVRAVLTPEQQQKFREMQRPGQGRGEGKGGGEGKAPGAKGGKAAKQGA